MQNIQRVLIRTADGERVVVDPLEVFVLEADEGRTRVRLASRHELVDVREIGELEALFAPFGFTEIHRSVLVNPRRVALIRRRDGDGRDWELKMEPPVNRVLPISRERLAARVAEPGAAERVARPRRAAGRPAVAGHRAMGPEGRPSPFRPYSCTAGPENHVPR
jgi:hypothetical protein